MKKIGIVFILFIIGYGIWVTVSGNHAFREDSLNKGNESTIETVGQQEKESVQPGRSFFSFKGVSSEELLTQLGEPTRRDQSGYGYEWWVYEQGAGKLLQLGMSEGEVVTGVLFHEEDDGPVRVGQSYEKVSQEYDLKHTVRLSSEGNYSLKLTEDDLKERPVISLDERWSAQLYFDRVTENLSAIRMIRNDVLLKHQPYKVVYRGSLSNSETLGEEKWKQVQEGVEQQIFTMTNVLRTQHGLERLLRHEESSQVAFLHSEDMDENNYFSHYSRNGDGLKERLEGVGYIRAGENIAAQYTDATSAIHGWLNSPGHRKTLLDPEYTHIGVGVHQLYYTQNFLTIP